MRLCRAEDGCSKEVVKGDRLLARCSNCGESGHVDCSRHKQDSSFNETCYNCGSVSHSAAEVIHRPTPSILQHRSDADCTQQLINGLPVFLKTLGARCRAKPRVLADRLPCVQCPMPTTLAAARERTEMSNYRGISGAQGVSGTSAKQRRASDPAPRHSSYWQYEERREATM